MRRTSHWAGFRTALAGAVVGGLIASALPAMAAQVGDALKLGEINAVNAQTALRGSTNDANLQIRNTGGGVPLSLKNNTGGVPNGQPPMEVDSRRLVKNLNVDRVDFFHANQLIRAAFDSTSDAPDADGNAVVATITAPKPGILLMGGSIDVTGTARDVYWCRLLVDGGDVTGTHRSAVVHWLGTGTTRNTNENCSTNGAKAVAAGTYSVALDMVDHHSATYLGASVWVIWVPFDGNGSVPVP